MAKADYALCAHCDGKAFYDAETDTLDTVTFHPDCLAAHDRAVKAEAWAQITADIKAAYNNPPMSVLSESGVSAWRVGMARAHKIARDGATQ